MLVKAKGECVLRRSEWPVVHLGESKNRDMSNERDNMEAINELDTNGGNSFFKVENVFVFGSNKAV